MHTLKQIDTPTKYLLLALPVVSAWIFIPQLSNAFEIKHHFSVLLSTLIVLLLFGRLLPDTLRIPKSSIGLALLLLVSAVFLSTCHAQNINLVTDLLFEFITFLLLAIGLYNLWNKKEMLLTLESGILIAGAGVAVFALKQYFLPEFLDPGFHALGKMKIYSTLGNSNLAAIIILAATPLAAWRAVHGTPAQRALFSLATLVLFTGLIATQARHALLAVAVAFVVAMLWLGTSRLRRMIIGCLIFLAAAASVILLLVDIPPALSHSINGRMFIWMSAWQMLLEHPFAGVGIGHFGLNHMAYQGALFSTGQYNLYLDNASVITEGHNDFLNWGAMTGVLGLTGFTLLCACVAWKGWHSAALKQQAPQLYLAFVAYLVAMFFVSLTAYTVPSLFFWLLFGMLFVYLDLPNFEWRPSAWLRYIVLAGLALLLLSASVLAGRDIGSLWHAAQGDKLMEEHDIWLADKEYQQALQWNEHNTASRKNHATVLFLEGELLQSVAELELTKRYSGDLGLYMLEGEILARLGDLERAADVYRQITSAFPNLVGPHFILGQVYQLQGKKNQSIEELNKVLEITPSPYNLNMTVEKVELQKQIVRDYLQGRNESLRIDTPEELPD